MLKKFFICLLVLLAFSCDSDAGNGKIELDFNFGNNQNETTATKSKNENTTKINRKPITNAIKYYYYDVPSYLESARNGNVASKTMLGLLYARGWSVEQDYEKAAYWLEDAIIYNSDEQHSVEKAMNYLALLYSEGLGVPKNLQKAEELLAKATDYGSEYGKELFPEYCRNYELVKNGKSSVLKKIYPDIVSPAGKVTGDNVNVRSGPGTSSRVLGRLNRGVSVNVIETETLLDGVWCHVIISGGLSEGWIFGKYLQPNKAPAKIDLNLFALKIDENNFPDQFFRSYVRMNFDNDMNNILSDEEIKKATYIGFSEKQNFNVRSIKGIEYLKNIKQIYCDGNYFDQNNSITLNNYIQLKDITLNKSGISQLTIENCPTLESIRTDIAHLRIENCPALKSFTDRFLGVQEVTIQNCPNLKDLHCHINVLEKINYKKYSKLETIFCTEQEKQRDFIPIDFSENKMLKSVICHQKTSRMQVEKKDELFCVDLGKHIEFENIKNIIFESLDEINKNIAKYNKDTGEIFFMEKPSDIVFYYQTHSPQNAVMRVSMRPYMDFDEFKKLCEKNSPEEIITELNYRGLDFNSKIRYGFDGIDYHPLIFAAASCASPQILKTLTNLGADINVSDDNGNTPILSASSYENVKFFIDMGANVNSPNKWGQTPLMRAIEIGNIQTIQMLLEHGANVNAKKQSGTPVLMCIDPYGDPQLNLQILQVLIDAGVDINVKDNDGRTALMYFMPDEYTSDCYIVPLIKAGADVNAQNNEGQTVLCLATQYVLHDEHNDPDYYIKNLITDLIKAGARGDIRDKSGYCPVEDKEYGKDIRALIKKYQK